jgi:hypothetical protein
MEAVRALPARPSNTRSRTQNRLVWLLQPFN